MEEKRSYNEKSVDSPGRKIIIPLSHEYCKNQKSTTDVSTGINSGQQESILEPVQPRRSNRSRVSTFDTQLRDYYSK